MPLPPPNKATAKGVMLDEQTLAKAMSNPKVRDNLVQRFGQDGYRKMFATFFRGAEPGAASTLREADSPFARFLGGDRTLRLEVAG